MIMKRKEIQQLAKKIAKLELIIQNSDDKKEVHRAEEEVMRISANIGSLADMEAIDEAVQEILSKNF